MLIHETFFLPPTRHYQTILALLSFLHFLPLCVLALPLKPKNMPETMPIPEPKGLPILGNVQELELETPLRSMLSLADRFGEIYRLRLPGKALVFVTTQALCDEVCNEKRFRKSVGGVLGVSTLFPCFSSTFS